MPGPPCDQRSAAAGYTRVVRTILVLLVLISVGCADKSGAADAGPPCSPRTASDGGPRLHTTMSPPRPYSLPRHRSDAWLGGFAIDAPVYTSSISARGGSVVAGTERLYRLRPGTTRFGLWE